MHTSTSGWYTRGEPMEKLKTSSRRDRRRFDPSHWATDDNGCLDGVQTYKTRIQWLQTYYVLINTKWKNSVMNIVTYSSFASVGSDHRIVTIKFRLSLRTPKAPPSKTRYDWKLLKFDDQLCSQFSLELGPDQ